MASQLSARPPWTNSTCHRYTPPMRLLIGAWCIPLTALYSHAVTKVAHAAASPKPATIGQPPTGVSAEDQAEVVADKQRPPSKVATGKADRGTPLPEPGTHHSAQRDAGTREQAAHSVPAGGGTAAAEAQEVAHPPAPTHEPGTDIAGSSPPPPVTAPITRGTSTSCPALHIMYCITPPWIQ